MPHNCFYERDRQGTFTTAISMLYKTAMLFLENGLHVILDHIILRQEPWPLADLLTCVQALHPAHVTFVFVSCPLAELKRRELARGDRDTGLAKGQYHRLLAKDLYDQVVDSSTGTPSQCASQIIHTQHALLQRGAETSFDRLYRTYCSKTVPPVE